jgi:hypothetical protein
MIPTRHLEVPLVRRGAVRIDGAAGRDLELVDQRDEPAAVEVVDDTRVS